MPESLAPRFLLSMPQLVDPNFNRTVVLLCEHSVHGALGFVVNRPALATGRLLVSLEPPVTADRELQVWIGGPVDPQRSWMLVGSDPPDGDSGVRIADGLHLSTAPVVLSQLLTPDPPPRTRLIVGHAGWGPGQLEAELRESAWLLGEVDTELIFGTPPDRMWETAIRRLGADPAALRMSRGVH